MFTFGIKIGRMEVTESSFLESVIAGIVETSIVEWIAVLTGLLYVIFAALKNQICWLFAFVSAGLYVYLCIDSQLYIESGLQLFYVATAVMGWVSWKKAQAPRSNDLLDEQTVNSGSDIRLWSLKNHLINFGVSGAISLGLGFAFDYYTDQANPYIDSFTTIFSLAATIMVIQKVLENWIYWIVIDLVGVYLYFQRGLQLSSVLYVLFTIIAVVGFWNWLKMYKTQQQ